MEKRGRKPAKTSASNAQQTALALTAPAQSTVALTPALAAQQAVHQLITSNPNRKPKGLKMVLRDVRSL